jgi:molecular chaperone GrpE
LGAHPPLNPHTPAPAPTPAPAAPPPPAQTEPPVADEDERAALGAEEPEGELASASHDGAEQAEEVDLDALTAEQAEEVDLDALTAKAEKADEYLALAQRTKADFENYRKRSIREAAAAQDRGVAKLAMELLPAVDNLDRALEAAEVASTDEGAANADNGGSASLVSGIRLVHADVIAALARVGIEPFSPRGEPFDPQHHEAIAQQPVEGAASGTVVEVYQRGYRLGETVLRPARVVVAQ